MRIYNANKLDLGEEVSLQFDETKSDFTMKRFHRYEGTENPHKLLSILDLVHLGIIKIDRKCDFIYINYKIINDLMMKII